MTPLYIASQSGQLGAVNILAAAGADCNQADAVRVHDVLVWVRDEDGNACVAHALACFQLPVVSSVSFGCVRALGRVDATFHSQL